jgi:hypothetical protein
MIALLALMQVSVTAPAPPRSRPIPATEWSCALEDEQGGRFRLSGRLDEIPAGWDPNRSRPTEIDGEGMALLLGKASMTSGEAGEHFRDYQIGIVRGEESYYVNLKLRRGGLGVAYVTRFVSGPDHQPYTYIAAGLCTSQFDVAPRSTGQ